MTKPLDVLSNAEAAGLLGVSRRTLHRWIGKGIIPATKLPGTTGQYVIRRTDIDRYRAKQEKTQQALAS